MDPQLQALLERGEEFECLEYSEVDTLVEALELGEEEIEDALRGDRTPPDRAARQLRP